MSFKNNQLVLTFFKSFINEKFSYLFMVKLINENYSSKVEGCLWIVGKGIWKTLGYEEVEKVCNVTKTTREIELNLCH